MKLIRLGEVVKIARGTTYKSALKGLPGPILLGLGSIHRNGGFRKDNLETYGGDSPEKLLVHPGELYASLKDVTQSADLLGAVARLPKSGTVGRLTQDTVRLDLVGDQVPTEYLYWVLRTPEYRSYCRSHLTGTTNLGLPRDDFLAFQFPEPDTSRLSIAQALDAIDEKIDSLQETLRLSQELAQALFNYWFVNGKNWTEDRQITWRSGKLSDVLVLRRDSAKPDDDLELPYVPIDVLKKKSLAIGEARPTSEAKSSLIQFRENDILIGAMRVYFHRVSIAPFAGVTRTTTFVLRPKSPELLAFGLLLCNQDQTIEFAQRTSKGSTMPYAVWDGGLAEMELLIPPHEVLSEFSQNTMPLIDLIKQSGSQVKKLEQLRETLLLRLISGSLHGLKVLD